MYRYCPLLYFLVPRPFSLRHPGATLLLPVAGLPLLPSCILMERLPQILPTNLPHPGPFLSTYSKERHHQGPQTCRLFLHGLVVRFSQLSLLPHFFQFWIQYFSPFSLKALPTHCSLEPHNPGGPPDSVTYDWNQWASYSALLKLIIPHSLLWGFQERTRMWRVQLSARLNQS